MYSQHYHESMYRIEFFDNLSKSSHKKMKMEHDLLVVCTDTPIFSRKTKTFVVTLPNSAVFDADTKRFIIDLQFFCHILEPIPLSGNFIWRWGTSTDSTLTSVNKYYGCPCMMYVATHKYDRTYDYDGSEAGLQDILDSIGRQIELLEVPEICQTYKLL